MWLLLQKKKCIKFKSWWFSQALAQQGQIINGASVPSLGTVAIGTAGGTISAIPLNNAQGTMHAATAALGSQQSVIGTFFNFKHCIMCDGFLPLNTICGTMCCLTFYIWS